MKFSSMAFPTSTVYPEHVLVPVCSTAFPLMCAYGVPWSPLTQSFVCRSLLRSSRHCITCLRICYRRKSITIGASVPSSQSLWLLGHFSELRLARMKQMCFSVLCATSISPRFFFRSVSHRLAMPFVAAVAFGHLTCLVPRPTAFKGCLSVIKQTCISVLYNLISSSI